MFYLVLHVRTVDFGDAGRCGRQGKVINSCASIHASSQGVGPVQLPVRQQHERAESCCRCATVKSSKGPMLAGEGLVLASNEWAPSRDPRCDG